MDNIKDIEATQKELYLRKFKTFGDDARSLSWADQKTQFLRFSKIAGLFKYEHSGSRFSVHEVGCGLAHFKDFLDQSEYNCSYSGSDVVAEFIEHNKARHPSSEFFENNIAADYENIGEGIKHKDYYCVSGTFYTKQDNSAEDWSKFTLKATKNMFKMAKKAICVNFLSTCSDFYDARLFYCDPREIMNFAVTNLSRFVVIAQDTPLFEFFVFVYKEDFIKSVFVDYDKYFKSQ